MWIIYGLLEMIKFFEVPLESRFVHAVDSQDLGQLIAHKNIPVDAFCIETVLDGAVLEAVPEEQR